MSEQHIIAMACVLEGFSSAIDASGDVMRRACRSLHEGLALADAMGTAESDAVQIVRQLLDTLEDKTQD
jgi:hypothetical protein